MAQEYVKENIPAQPPVAQWVLACALAATLGSLGVAVLIDAALPEPLTRDAPADRFIAEIAHEHLVNLTSIGPRVAGSYENEVLAVNAVVAALRGVAAAASPHNLLELDVQRAHGAFSLAFFDGMNNVYRDVQSVVARARAVGEQPGRGGRTALLLNCHYDTVPDSPGASDDGAGCAVGLETLRALVAAARPLRHPVLLLLNGAEENIMQASHAFITQHKWASSVRAFINVEACGAGGREVLFQAGPGDPWIMQVYAQRVPHPFASSLAQELFESGLVPADTDFRIFRDFGKLSGVDLAWSAEGYVYHTRLDVAARVPPASLQRTGDNVLALATGMLESAGLSAAAEPGARQPVFFDVLGVLVLAASPLAALLAALLALALVALRLRCSAAHAAAHLLVRRRRWAAWVCAGAARAVLAGAAGAAAGVGAALALAAGGAPLGYYARPWLAGPLLALPAAAAAGAVAGRSPLGALGGLGGRGRWWWAARLAADAVTLCWALLLGACLLLRLRSGFLPLLWALLPTLADLLANLLRVSERVRAWLWALGAVVPVLQTSYLSLNSLAMFIPLCGRSGTPPLPPDVVVALAVAALTLATCSWMVPLVVAARGRALLWGMAGVSAASLALVVSGAAGAAYTAERPQRLMVFHVARTTHHRVGANLTHHAHHTNLTDHYYWVPELDVNTARTIDSLPGWVGRVATNSAGECGRWVYCGAPYSLPVLGLVGAGHSLPARPPVAAHARVDASVQLDPARRRLNITLTGPSHVVVIVSPAAGGRVSRALVGPLGAGAPGAGAGAAGAGRGGPGGLRAVDPLREGAAWGSRRTYFIALHAARRPRAQRWQLLLDLDLPEVGAQEEAVQVSIAGHGLAGGRRGAHHRLLHHLPPHVAPTGWPVHLHLYRL